MPIPHRPGQRGWFERNGDRLLGQVYRDMVEAGTNIEAQAKQPGKKLVEVPGGVKLVDVEEEGDEGAGDA